MLMATGLAVVVVYLMLSINTYLETQVFGRFSLGYGRLGPTEARVALIAFNVSIVLGAPLQPAAGTGLTALDAVGLSAAGLMLAALAVRAVRNLDALALREPPPRPAPRTV